MDTGIVITQIATGLSYSAFVGILLMFVTRRRLGRYCLVVFCGAMTGGALAIGLAVYDRIAVVGFPAQGSDHYWVTRILGQYATWGGLVGGVTVVMVGSWLAARSVRLEVMSTIRWYRPGKFAIVGFVLLITLVGWLAVREHTERKRFEARCTIQNLGGTLTEIEFRPNAVEGDSIEIDLRNTALTDAGLVDIITLNPHRLCVGGTKVTDVGIKTLQRALPHCKIYWEPPPPPAR